MTPSTPLLRVAVVGHTNTGKTSLLRTLTRDARFGQVSDRPATTRHVEGATLLVHGAPQVELYDTPGLEDSIGLLEYLDDLRADRRQDWIEVIRAFLDDPDEAAPVHDRFEQEAKAIRQVLASDAALYVVDCRERVLGKHRDELEILARCARPLVPVLNFLASPEAQVEAWREHLRRLGLHAVAEFDTVVLNETAERRLFETMITLLDRFRPTLEALIADREAERRRLVSGAAGLIADLLIDVAAHTVSVPGDADKDAAIDALQDRVRLREQQTAEEILALFRFRSDDYEAEAVPAATGQWGRDPFDPDLLTELGISVGSGAAVGAATGLTVDVLLGGLSLGAATALGALVGATWSGAESHGQRLWDRARGYAELRVDDATLRLLAVRQIGLAQALLRRGHASQDKIRMVAEADTARQGWVKKALPDPVKRARRHPEWSRLTEEDSTSGGRDKARAALAQEIEAALRRP